MGTLPYPIVLYFLFKIFKPHDEQYVIMRLK